MNILPLPQRLTIYWKELPAAEVCGSWNLRLEGREARLDCTHVVVREKSIIPPPIVDRSHDAELQATLRVAGAVSIFEGSIEPESLSEFVELESGECLFSSLSFVGKLSLGKP